MSVNILSFAISLFTIMLLVQFSSAELAKVSSYGCGSSSTKQQGSPVRYGKNTKLVDQIDKFAIQDGTNAATYRGGSFPNNAAFGAFKNSQAWYSIFSAGDQYKVIITSNIQGYKGPDDMAQVVKNIFNTCQSGGATPDKAFNDYYFKNYCRNGDKGFLVGIAFVSGGHVVLCSTYMTTV